MAQAATCNNAGQPKYSPINSSDGLEIVLPTPAASGQQVRPRLSAFEGLIDPTAPAESSSGRKHVPYDVFISHHGEDAKHRLANSIHKKLDATGLRVFLDKNELKLGDFFPEALEEAMASASLQIAIFSENYAQSPWCLAELAFMMQTGVIFIPIFYHVDPSSLRWAIEGKGAYANAFKNHEKKGRYSSEKLQSWKLALHKASLYTGEIINNQGDEEKVLTNVVNQVLKELKKQLLHVAKHAVGLDELERDFDDCIALQSAAGPTQVVGIWGMGGAGKTTLAKQLYNNKCSTFEKSSFVFDVREAGKKELLHEKQKDLLKDLDLKSKSLSNVDQGKEILRSRLRSVSVLIVLDDVDHTNQLDALLPARESLGHGSLIIVTTRDLRVLKAWGISALHKITTLNPAHAHQLFCWHAFGQPSPVLGFEELAQKFVDACRGLPLSLVVLGSQLYGESSKTNWQSQLDKLSRLMPDDIKSRLKISYDVLDREEKEMFLDMACFFFGRLMSTAIAVWDGSGWNGLHGLQSLVNKCLVELDEKNSITRIRMHDNLRDLGREIANQHSPYRLWSREQIIEIQPQQESIRIRQMADAFGDNCYPSEGKIILNTSQGERILEPGSLGLKIFSGNGDFINEERSKLSTELLFLHCDRFEHKIFPSWLSLKKLRVLDLNESQRLEDLWERDVHNWQREVMICTRAVIDVESLKNFFTSFPLKNIVEYGSSGSVALSMPEIVANAIMICFVIDDVHPDLCFHISTDRDNHFKTEMSNGKWLWMGIFPQGSNWLQSKRYQIQAFCEDKEVKVKVKEAWLLTGKEQSILESFHQLSQRKDEGDAYEKTSEEHLVVQDDAAATFNRPETTVVQSCVP